MLSQKNAAESDAISAGVVPVRLPIIGTTWYERKTSYWLRRVWYTILMAITVAIETVILAAIWADLKSTTGRIIFAVVEASYTLAISAIVFRKLRKSYAAEGIPRQPLATSRARGAEKTGGLIGVLTRAGSASGAVFIVVGSLLTYGLVLTIFLRSFLPRLDGESQARAALTGKASLEQKGRSDQ